MSPVEPALPPDLAQTPFAAPTCWSGVGAGWNPLLREAHELLSAADPDYTIAQFKEKFGRLTIYVDADRGAYDQVNAIVDELAARSTGICETCGRPGRLRSGPWIKTLCDDHAEDRPELRPPTRTPPGAGS